MCLANWRIDVNETFGRREATDGGDVESNFKNEKRMQFGFPNYTAICSTP